MTTARVAIWQRADPLARWRQRRARARAVNDLFAAWDGPSRLDREDLPQLRYRPVASVCDQKMVNS
jgi:hypothetical protein